MKGRRPFRYRSPVKPCPGCRAVKNGPFPRSLDRLVGVGFCWGVLWPTLTPETATMNRYGLAPSRSPPSFGILKLTRLSSLIEHRECMVSTKHFGIGQHSSRCLSRLSVRWCRC